METGNHGDEPCTVVSFFRKQINQAKFKCSKSETINNVVLCTHHNKDLELGSNIGRVFICPKINGEILR